MVHNFIRIHDPDDVLADSIDHEDDEPDLRGRLQSHITAEERERAAARRDAIAKAMWADYKARGHR